MKFTISRGDLIKSLAHVQSVVERRNIVPVLDNFLLDVQGDALCVTATDMEITVINRVDGLAVSRPGTTTVPAEMLYDIARKLPDGAMVDFDHEPDTQSITIKSGRFRTLLDVLPADDFPKVSNGPLPHSFDVAASDMLRLLSKVEFAMSTEQTRYWLNGIYLHAPDGSDKLRAVALDGRRLALLEMPLPEGAEAIPGVIIPRRTVVRLQRLLIETPGAVNVMLSDNMIRVVAGAVEITSKLLEGKFPVYDHVIPKGNDRHLRVTRAALLDGIGRMSAVAVGKDYGIKFVLSTDSLTLSSRGDRGHAEEVIDGATYDGADMQVGFNARYVTDIVSNMGDVIEFNFADEQSTVLITDPASDDMLYLLMTMRI